MTLPVAPNINCAPAAGSDLLAFVHSWAMADDAMARLATMPSTTDATLLTLILLLRFSLEPTTQRRQPVRRRMLGTEHLHCHGSRPKRKRAVAEETGCHPLRPPTDDQIRIDGWTSIEAPAQALLRRQQTRLEP